MMGDSAYLDRITWVGCRHRVRPYAALRTEVLSRPPRCLHGFSPSARPFTLVPNRRRRVNKVLFALDDSATGWYVYLLAPLPRLTVMREGESRVGKGRLMSVPVELEDGFVPVGTNVEGPEGLEAVLSHWAEASNTETVGKIGRRGGSPVITVEMGLDKFVLNRDTTRPAVHDFLAAAARAGGAFNLRWHVARRRPPSMKGGVPAVGVYEWMQS